MNNDNYGESFLNRLYKDLHMSDEVMHTSIPNDTKDEKVSKYLNRLEKVEDLAKNSKYNGLELLKELYYKKYVIKPENVPESYFELQKKIALERGYGHVEIHDDEKKQMIDTIINDQKKSLDTWLDYLMSEDVIYPEWFKYYAFQGMIKLGSYDKQKASFNKRTDSTTSVFVELNREALALVYDNLYSSLQGNKVDDELLQKLLDGGSFSKLYSYMLNKIESTNKDLNSNEGIWIKYNQGSNPDELVKSLEGKGTGWCTAGIETARIQLEGGDFYVFYTKDSNNEYKQPRIAIRMEGHSIGEVRGIASSQNIESEMEQVVEEKLKEFPDKDKYKKKVNDMKFLTEIYNSYKTRELTIEELRFLYEIDDVIEGFGYQKDPRITEILKNRNIKKDLSQIFNCSEDEVTNDKNEVLNNNKLKYFYGDLVLSNLINIDDLVLPEYVIGNLDLSNLVDAKKLKFPNKIDGNLYLSCLISAEGLTLPNEVGGSLHLNSVTSVENLKFPNTIGKDLFLYNLKSAKNLVLPNEIGGSLYLSGLTSVENLVLPNEVGGNLNLSSLTNANGLKFQNKLAGNLFLGGLTSAKDLVLPNEIGGTLDLNSLTSAKDLVLPNEIGGNLNLHSLTSAKDLILPNKIGGDLELISLKSAEGLILSSDIIGGLDLRGLTSAKDLVLPNEINGCLDLSNLTSAEGLILPENVNGYLYLNRLINVENLILPTNVGGDLYLSRLVSAKNLRFPNNVGGDLRLDHLSYAEELILPNYIEGNLNLNHLTDAKGIIFPNEIGENLTLNRLVNADGLKFPNKVGYDLNLLRLKNAKNVILPNYIGKNLILEELLYADDLKLPNYIGQELNIYSLESVDGLIVPKDLHFKYIDSKYLTAEDLIKKSFNDNDDRLKQKGFSKIFILLILNIFISILLLFFGILFTM